MKKRDRYPSETAERTQVRLTDGMRDRLKEAAAENNRSMNAEIIARIERSFAINLPDDMLLRLEDDAKKNGQSLSDEIWARIVGSHALGEQVVSQSKYIAELLAENHKLKDEYELRLKMDGQIGEYELLMSEKMDLMKGFMDKLLMSARLSISSEDVERQLDRLVLHHVSSLQEKEESE